jgi:hypothetical protein
MGGRLASQSSGIQNVFASSTLISEERMNLFSHIAWKHLQFIKECKKVGSTVKRGRVTCKHSRAAQCTLSPSFRSPLPLLTRSVSFLPLNAPGSLSPSRPLSSLPSSSSPKAVAALGSSSSTRIFFPTTPPAQTHSGWPSRRGGNPSRPRYPVRFRLFTCSPFLCPSSRFPCNFGRTSCAQFPMGMCILGATRFPL